MVAVILSSFNILEKLLKNMDQKKWGLSELESENIEN